jgi:DNA-binding Lrp family transcriptional regulator
LKCPLERESEGDIFADSLLTIGLYDGDSFDRAMLSKAFVLINAELGTELDTVRMIQKIPNVVEAHLVYGTYDIIVKVEGDSLDNVKDTITRKLRTLPSVRSTLSMVVVDEQHA